MNQFSDLKDKLNNEIKSNLQTQTLKYAKFVASLDDKTKDLIKFEQALAIKNQEDINFIKKVLLTKPELRESEDLARFSKQIMNIKFFKERQQLGQEDILELCNSFQF